MGTTRGATSFRLNSSGLISFYTRNMFWPAYQNVYSSGLFKSNSRMALSLLLQGLLVISGDLSESCEEIDLMYKRYQS